MIVRPLDRIPDLDALAAADPDQYPFLLRSVPTEGQQHGCDILFAADADALALWHDGERFRLDATGDAPADGGDDFLAALNRWFESLRLATTSTSAWPFTGGWFVYLGYDLARQIEPACEIPMPRRQPIAYARRCRAAVCVRRGSPPQAAIVAEDGGGALADRLARDCARPLSTHPVPRGPLPLLAEPDGAEFTAAVERALLAIADGEVYQANLSRRWTAPCDAIDASALFAALNLSNPAPFSALARLPALTIVSSSPERLVEVRGRVVATRPIAGTRRRGETPEQDAALLRELREHPKEQAEHVMLIDLERNDLGRICRAGSVRVDEYMGIESYAFVHHIVSNVEGELRDGVGPGDVLRAVFPGGTITGCPKVRCMQLIGTLEARPRGAYTGSLGYLNRTGDMDMNILIRTLEHGGGRLSLAAGAGIVADSDPLHELAETRAKAEGLLRALQSTR